MQPADGGASILLCTACRNIRPKLQYEVSALLTFVATSPPDGTEPFPGLTEVQSALGETLWKVSKLILPETGKPYFRAGRFAHFPYDTLPLSCLWQLIMTIHSQTCELHEIQLLSLHQRADCQSHSSQQPSPCRPTHHQ